jgi:hypothetical protein
MFEAPSKVDGDGVEGHALRLVDGKGPREGEGHLSSDGEGSSARHDGPSLRAEDNSHTAHEFDGWCPPRSGGEGRDNAPRAVHEPHGRVQRFDEDYLRPDLEAQLSRRGARAV